MAIFCTASHWNTEAILLAAQRFAEKNNISKIPVAVSMTFNYPHMPQSERITYSRDSKAGFISIMHHLRALCQSDKGHYERVVVLPHLDHADHIRDRWALTQALPYLSSVMFDAQRYPFEKNLALTEDYVRAYGDQVMVEGVMEELKVHGNDKSDYNDEDYIGNAVAYTKRTGVDFLVADLGTEQQSQNTGEQQYLSKRAQGLTNALGRSMLVLHGTSCLASNQMTSLGKDGIIRVNMWTRIVREAGQYASQKVMERYDDIRRGIFEAAESRQYLMDCTVEAARIMEDIMGVLGYASLDGLL